MSRVWFDYSGFFQINFHNIMHRFGGVLFSFTSSNICQHSIAVDIFNFEIK